MESNYSRHDVDETPFSIIQEDTTKKCRIAVGMQFVTDQEFEDLKKAENYIKEKPWELILNTVIILHNNIHKLEKEDEKC